MGQPSTESGPECRRPSPLRAEDDRGLTSLEMAILFPTVLLVILTMFQISLYWHTANAAGVAAEEGVDAGQVFPDDPARARTEAQIAARAILDSTNHGTGDVTVAVNGNLFSVTVVADSPRIIGIGRWQVRSVAEGRFEEFVPASGR